MFFWLILSSLILASIDVDFYKEYFLHEQTMLDMENLKLNAKNDIRLVTFNVHEFSDANATNSTLAIDSFIKNIDADVLVLQEIPNTDEETEMNDFRTKYLSPEFAFVDFLYCKGESYHGLGNVILSKHKIKLSKTLSFAQVHQVGRCALFAHIEINNMKLNIFGTHLEVVNKKVRELQIREILKKMKLVKGYGTNFLLADINTNRESSVFQLVESAGLKDSISLQVTDKTEILNKMSAMGTCWVRNEIDFIFADVNSISLFEFKSNVYHTAASDHLPVIADLKILNQSHGSFSDILADQDAGVFVWKHDSIVVPSMKDSTFNSSSVKPIKTLEEFEAENENTFHKWMFLQSGSVNSRTLDFTMFITIIFTIFLHQ